AVGFAGVAFLVVGRGSGSADPTGLGLLLVATVSWALGTFLSPRLRLPRDGLLSTGIQQLAGGMILVVLAAALGELSHLEPATWSTGSLVAMAYLVVFGSLVAFTAYGWLLQHAPVSLVATYAYVNAVVEHRWTREEIVRGEMQHYLRVSQNPVFFGYIVTNVTAEKNYDLMPIVMENFMEELGGERTHVDVMLQMLEEAGMDKTAADRAEPAPGTMAAIEMIVGGCQRRSALEGIALLSFVEAMHGGPDGAAAGMFDALTKHYGFSKRAAATY